MAITLVLVAAVIGIVARRSPRVAVGITVALIVVASVAILTRTGSSIVDLIPLLVGLIGIIAALGTLLVMHRGR